MKLLTTFDLEKPSTLGHFSDEVSDGVSSSGEPAISSKVANEAYDPVMQVDERASISDKDRLAVFTEMRQTSLQANEMVKLLKGERVASMSSELDN